MNLTYLSKLTDEQFELERARIISEYLSSLPAGSQKKLRSFQSELDLLRLSSTPEDFMKHLADALRENLENLGDQLVSLRNLTVGMKQVS